MTDFQPLGCGLGRPAYPPATPADTTETATMAKKTDSTADQILDVIAKAGGSISGTDLRDALPDVSDANRRYHAGQLRAQGRITTTGGTSNMVYHLADGNTASAPAERISNATRPKSAKAKKGAKPAKATSKPSAIVTEGTARRAALLEAVTKPRGDDLSASMSPASVDLADQHATTIAPQFLRRVLALALSRPGDIHDTDRQALAAVAAGC